MPDHPFHVAGGVFLNHSPAGPEIDASFLTRPRPNCRTCRKRPAPPPAQAVGNSPQVPLPGGRQLLCSEGVAQPDAQGHAPAARHQRLRAAHHGRRRLRNRSRLAELLNTGKTLRPDHPPLCRQQDGRRRHASSGAKPRPAAWSCPAPCGRHGRTRLRQPAPEHEIYGDIHMIQHQVGTGARADLKTLQALRTENAELRRQVDVLRQDAEAARHERPAKPAPRRAPDRTACRAGRAGCLHCPPVGRAGAAARQRAGTAPAPGPGLPRRRCRRTRHRPRCPVPQAGRNRGPPAAPACWSSPQPTIARRKTPPYLTRRTKPCERPPANRSTASACSVSAAVPGGGRLPRGGRAPGRRFLHHDGGLEESLHRIDSASPQPTSSSARRVASATTPIGA